MSPVKETDKQATLGSVPIIIIMREKKKAKGECECERKMICISFDTETKKKWEVGHPPPPISPVRLVIREKTLPMGRASGSNIFLLSLSFSFPFIFL